MAERRPAGVIAVQVTTTEFKVDAKDFCEHVQFWINAGRLLTYGRDREGTKGFFMVGAPRNSPAGLCWKMCPIDGIPCDVEQD